MNSEVYLKYVLNRTMTIFLLCIYLVVIFDYIYTYVHTKVQTFAVHNSKFVNLKHVVVYYVYKSIVRINDATHKNHAQNHLKVLLFKELRLFFVS